MYVVRKFEALSYNSCCCGKAIIITYSVCESVALGIRHAKLIGRILSSVTYLDLQYFTTLCHKQHDFRRKKFIEPNTCVLIFSTKSF
jgi:hypothetical protein